MQLNRQEIGQPLMLVFDRQEEERICCICTNGEAVAVRPGGPFPSGTELVFASWTAKKDSSGALLRDGQGNLVRERLSTLYFMRKRPAQDILGLPQGSSAWECRSMRVDPSTDALLSPAQ